MIYVIILRNNPKESPQIHYFDWYDEISKQLSIKVDSGLWKVLPELDLPLPNQPNTAHIVTLSGPDGDLGVRIIVLRADKC